MVRTLASAWTRRFVLTSANTTNQTAVEATTWGAVKSLYR